MADGQRRSKGQRFGSLITKAGDKVVHGIEKATPMVQSGIHKGQETVIAKTAPCPEGQEAQVDVAKFRKARETTATAAKITGKVSGAVTAAAVGVAHSLTGGAKQRSGNEKPATGVKAVAGAVGNQVVNILGAVETAGQQTLETTCTATEEVVGHKYGGHAKQAAGEGLGAVQNTAQCAMDMRGVSAKAFAKKMVKQAGNNVAGGPSGQPQPQAPGSAYPQQPGHAPQQGYPPHPQGGYTGSPH